MKIDLLNGDCLEIMKTMADESIDLTVTSPPYDNLRTYNGNISQWNEQKWKDIIKELFRVIKKGGVVVWVVGDATIKGSETGTSFKQALYFKKIGFNLHDTMIWEKNTFSNPFPNKYHQVFEYMFVFSKEKIKTFNPIIDRKNVKPGLRTSITVREKNGELTRRNPKTVSELGKRFNVWKISNSSSERNRNIKKLKHPATFPEQLALDHIISWSKESDIVLDPFMGSGTTGVACKHLNRNFIGIELDKTYFEIAKKRIEQAGSEN